MSRIICTLLLIFPFFISNAQVEHSSKALVASIVVENSRQLYSRSEENNNIIAGAGFSRFSDGTAQNLKLAIGSKKLLDNDNYHAWSIVGGGSSWDRNDVFDLQDSLGNRIDELRFFAGKVTNYSIGLRYTYGLSLTHSEKLNFLIGFRGELFEQNYSAPATEGVGFDKRFNEISIRTFVLPELQYIIPDSRFLLSVRIGFPVSSFGVDSERVENPALTLSQQRNGGLSFELFDLNGSLFELAFGYFLKSK